MSWIGKNFFGLRAAKVVEADEGVYINGEAIARITRHPEERGVRPKPEPEDPVLAVVEMMERTLTTRDLVGFDPAFAHRYDRDDWWTLRFHVALNIGIAQAVLRLCVFDDDPFSDPALDAIADDAAAGRPIRAGLEAWVRAHLRRRELAPAKLNEQVTRHPGLERLAYLAGSLTGWDETQQERVLLIQESLAWKLAAIGIRSYIPTLHTTPHDPPAADNDPRLIHHVDYDAVIGSDLVVALAWPSIGTGKELAWGEAGRELSIIVWPQGLEHVSRLPRGTTCRREVLDAGSGGLDDLIKPYHWELWLHAIERHEVEVQYEELLVRLRAEMDQIRQAVGVESLFTPDRAEEMVQSANHLLHSSGFELQDLARVTGVPILSELDVVPDDLVLDDRELGGLEQATRFRPLPPRRVAVLVQAALTEKRRARAWHDLVHDVPTFYYAPNWLDLDDHTP